MKMLPDEVIRETAIRLKDDARFAKGIERFIYKGASMSPIFKEGDHMIVKYVKPRDLFMGDIIVYESGDKFIAHRFLYHKQGKDNISYISAKADNSSEEDAPFKAEHLLGRVIEINRIDKRLKLNDAFWRAISYMAGAISRSEAVIFKSVCFMRTGFFPKVKFKKGFKQNIAKSIRMPRLFFLKIIVFLRHRFI